VFCFVKGILSLVFLKSLVIREFGHLVFGVFFLSSLVLFSTEVNLFKSKVSY